MAAIQIFDYPVYMKIGFFEEEQLSGQEVLVSIKLHLDKSFNHFDDLGDTLDYGEVLEKIDETLSGKSMKLVETAVNHLGITLIKDFSVVKKVRVTIAKLKIPGSINKGARIEVSDKFRRRS